MDIFWTPPPPPIHHSHFVVIKCLTLISDLWLTTYYQRPFKLATFDTIDSTSLQQEYLTAIDPEGWQRGHQRDSWRRPYECHSRARCCCSPSSRMSGIKKDGFYSKSNTVAILIPDNQIQIYRNTKFWCTEFERCMNVTDGFWGGATSVPKSIHHLFYWLNLLV